MFFFFFFTKCRWVHPANPFSQYNNAGASTFPRESPEITARGRPPATLYSNHCTPHVSCSSVHRGAASARRPTPESVRSLRPRCMYFAMRTSRCGAATPPVSSPAFSVWRVCMCKWGSQSRSRSQHQHQHQRPQGGGPLTRPPPDLQPPPRRSSTLESQFYITSARRAHTFPKWWTHVGLFSARRPSVPSPHYLPTHGPRRPSPARISHCNCGRATHSPPKKQR